VKIISFWFSILNSRRSLDDPFHPLDTVLEWIRKLTEKYENR